MISATSAVRPSLADVIPSSLRAISGQNNILNLPAVDKVVVLLVDGLGVSSLKQRLGHARTMAGATTTRSAALAAWPTTTASSIATFTTGESAGIHGLVGYTVLDHRNDRVVNQLSGWDDQLDPATWQRVPTLFETAAEQGLPSVVVAHGRYRDSGFTRAVLRGARYVGARTIADRFDSARTVLDDLDRGVVYIYVPELDQTAHSHGWESQLWTEWLETLDAELGRFVRSLTANEGMLLTADHGVLDVPTHSHILFGDSPDLVDGLRFVAGEPRCLQLHFEPDASSQLRKKVVDRWKHAESDRSQVVTRSEAIQNGWFGGVVHPDVEPRIGDIVVAARKAVAYYDTRAESQSGRLMIGQHGSFSDEERTIPLLRYGAFALG